MKRSPEHCQALKQAKANQSPARKALARQRLRATQLGITLSELERLDKERDRPRTCPRCGNEFQLTRVQWGRLRKNPDYLAYCTVACGNQARWDAKSKEDRKGHGQSCSRAMLRVHAQRTPEERHNIALRGHLDRDYTNLRKALAAVPYARRVAAAKAGHSRRSPGQLQETWNNKSPDELGRIFRERIKTSQARGNYSGTSRWEEEAYALLVAAFGSGSQNVVRQHADSRYPYPCDFYLPKYDVFIELHGFWVHGPGPYDSKNPEHLRLAEAWRKKAKTQSMYAAALKAWTVRDPAKVEAARAHRLNLYRFYSVDELKSWLKVLKTRKVLSPIPVRDPWFDRLSKINAGRIVKHFQFKTFHAQELEAWADLGTRIKLYANRQTWVGKQPAAISDQSILTGLNLAGLARGYSSFDPVWLHQFVALTGAQRIYDPCGGWGHRMLAAAHSGVDYIYNDVNLATARGALRIKAWLSKKSQARSRIWVGNNDAADPCLKATLRGLEPDSVFTCPPYHAAEWYSAQGAENLAAEEFALWWGRVLKTFPRSVKNIGLVIPSKMLEVFTQGLVIVSQHALSRGDAVFFRSGDFANRSREVLVVAAATKPW